MDFTTLTISAHMTEERMERYIKIQMNTGIGEPVVELKAWKEGRWLYITDTGVAVIVDEDKTVLITMYYLTIEEAQEYLHANKYNRIRHTILKAIDKNVKRKLVASTLKKQKRENKQKWKRELQIFQQKEKENLKSCAKVQFSIVLI